MASSSSSTAPPPWVILSRIFLVQHSAVEDPLDLSLKLANPPRLSLLTELTSVHPEPTRYGADKYPAYVIAANDAGLLLHVSPNPSVTYTLEDRPSGVLAVARGFLPVPADDGRGVRTGTAVRVPDRVPRFQHRVSTVKSVGLLPVPGTGGVEYVVAELLVADRSCLLTFRSGSDSWDEEPLICPLVSVTSDSKKWTPHDVIAHDRNLWWVDLARGLLGCNLLDYRPELRYVELPEMFSFKDRAEKTEDIARHRVVRVSDGRLRFVDIAQKRDKPPGKTVVVVWTLASDPFAKDDDLSGMWPWKVRSMTKLETIWASDSYKARRMPEEVPALALLHPDKPDVVYFFLKEYLFAVDVRNSEVVDFTAGQYPTRVLYWRHRLAWVLPPSRPNALGHENQSSEELDSHDKKDVAPAS